MSIQERDEIAKKIVLLLVENHCLVKDLHFVWFGVKEQFGSLEVKEKEH